MPYRSEPSRDPAHRRPDVQGLRGIAVLLVVAFHAGLPLPGGFIGVDVFFVISGFVITGLLLREWTADQRLDLRRFYVRRIRRLLPALAVMVGVTSLAAILLLPPNGVQQDTAKTGLGAMFITANVIIPRLVGSYFARAATLNPLLHTWSLSVEEQFYLLFPTLLLVALLLARRRQGRAPIVLVALVSGASFVLSLVALYVPAVVSRLGVLADPFYSSLARAWEFGTGALVAMTAPALARAARPSGMVASGVFGAALLLIPATLVTGSTPFPGVAVIAPVLGTALLLMSGLAQPHLIVRGLSLGALVWIGDLSYSWYLWHWPAIVFGRRLYPHFSQIGLVGGAVSLLIAYASFRWIENPIRFSTALSRRKLIALVGSAGAAVVLAGVLGLGARRGWGQEWALGAHVVMKRECDEGPFDPDRCRWPAASATGSVLLLGDSQAWALADGLIPAAGALGYETIVGSSNNCPFVVPVDSPEAAPLVSPACAARNRGVLGYALEHKPRVIVIANQSAAYATAYREGWRTSLAATVRPLRQTGLGVVIVSVVPVADEQATRTSLLLKPAGDRFTSAVQVAGARHDATGADRFAAAANPGTKVFDPATVLCDHDRCVVARGGTEFYSDQNHLSRSGALLLEPFFRDCLREVAAGSSAP